MAAIYYENVTNPMVVAPAPGKSPGYSLTVPHSLAIFSQLSVEDGPGAWSPGTF